ncbi:polysaccharide biosynthesis protein, partial [Kouleothrix aurantiaca]
MQLTTKTIVFLIGTAGLLPLLGLAAWLWRRFYRDDESNTARRVLKNSALPIAATLVNKVVDLGFAAVTLRALGLAGNGAYSIVTTIVSLYLVTLTNWGLNDLTVREVAADHTRAPRLFSITLLLRCGLSVRMAPAAA